MSRDIARIPTWWSPGWVAPDNLRVVASLVGRRWELGALIDLLSSARSGRGRGLLLLGDAGIGKTTLAEALAAEATGCTVGWGRCPEIEALPFWPWRQALQPLDAAAPLTASAAGVRPSLFADVGELLARATATAPALLVLEDVHLADPASLALLQFLTGMLPELRCALLLTGRDNSVDLPTAAAAALEALPPVVGRLTLRGLDRADTAVLVEQVLGRPDAHIADAVYERTNGNPFFVQELTRLHAAKHGPVLGPPAGVQQVVGRRLARLRQSTNDCLSAAAVLGDDVDAAVVTEVVQLPVATVLSALDEAVDARLAVLDGARMRFAHALVREVLYEGLATGRRGLLHGRAGVVLAARRAADGTVADHFRRALGYPDAAEKAAEHALLAGRDAMRRGGYEQAVRYFRWAAEGGDDPGVRLGLGEAQVLAGQLPEGRRLPRELARERLAAHDGETAARALLAMGGGPGGFEVDLGDPEQATLLERALPMLDAGTTKAAALARTAVARAYGRTDEKTRALAQEAIDMASRLGDARTEAAAISAWCDTASGPDFVTERSARSRRMLALAEASGDRTLTMLARRLLIMALLEQGNFAAADEQIAAYASAAEQLHTAFYAWLVPIWRGMRALMRADYVRVDACLAQAAELARQAQSENADLMVFTLRIGKGDATGTMADYRDLIDEVMAPFSDAPMAQGYLAYYLVKAGERRRAARLVEQRVSDGIATIPKDAEWLTSVALLGEASRLLENRAAVTACAAALQPYRELWLYDGIGAACYGPVADFLDRFSEFLGTRPVEPRLEPTAGAVGELRRIGAAWSVSWRGEPATIADAKGVHDLATLLSHPRTPIHVLDLIGAGRSMGGDAGPLLDRQARTAYKTRLRELADELAEAEQFADVGRAERLRTEQQFLAHELAGALGLGGRVRVAGDPVERAQGGVDADRRRHQGDRPGARAAGPTPQGERPDRAALRVRTRGRRHLAHVSWHCQARTGASLEKRGTRPPPEEHRGRTMTTIEHTTAAEALAGRLFTAALGTAELFTVYLGQAHGLYQAVDDAGSTTAADLSTATGVERRYVLEWLQSQAISGLLTLDGPDIGSARFSLAPGVRETLLEQTGPFYSGGMPAVAVAVGRAFPQLEAAFTTGAGVPYVEYGPEAVTAQAALNRPAYVNSLVAEWVPTMPDVQARLAAGAWVADVGTGAGWAAIELAKAYPVVRVDGYDNDEESIARARRNAAEHGVADRVDFEVRDVDEIAAHGARYDLITFFECLHDLAHPVDGLLAARQALAPGGTVLVMDENVDETLVAPGDEVQRFFAAASVIWCTPQGRVDANSEVIGAVMRPARLHALAAEAGFRTVDVLPIEHPFWKFYRLNP